MSPYFLQPPACREYDPRAAEVAQRIVTVITRALPGVIVEHIGSTAVPGCAGKGIVDLMLLYLDGQLEVARDLLDGLGFERQTVGHLFPETRPMRVGSLEYQGERFRVHVHVIAASSPEGAALRAFRERLRADPGFMTAYVDLKRGIVAGGVSDARLYTEKKSAFILQALAEAGGPSLTSPLPD